MIMTGGSLNIKLVEKSLLDLFTDDVVQSVDRSHGKDSGNSRKQHAFDAKTMIRTSMKTETSLQTSKSCLTLTTTWPLMMKIPRSTPWLS